MLLSWSVPKFNQWLGPVLLRYSVRARFLLSRGIIRDNPYLDAFCGIPVALKLIQSEVYHECKALETTTKNTSKEKSMKASSHHHHPTKNDDETQRRLQILERYIRPALLPNNTWADVQLWQFHHRILKWLRTEYLIVKYRPTLRTILLQQPQPQSNLLRNSPQLTRDFFGETSSSARQNHNDPLSKMMSSIGSVWGSRRRSTTATVLHETSVVKLLPHSATLTQLFHMTDWERQHKNLTATRANMERIAQRITGGTVMKLRGGSIGIAYVEDLDPRTVDVTHLSMDEVLEVVGGHVLQCNAFNALCEDANIYQFWTREYIELLGRYLLQRSAILQQQQQQSATETQRNETIILDVGAGDGLLAQLLREFMTTEYKNINTTTRITQQKSKSNAVSSASSSKQRGHDKSTTALPHSATTTTTNDERTATTTRIGTHNTTVPTIIASDSGAWGISPIAPVVQQTVEEALEPYLSPNTTTHPQQVQYNVIVLCSWMPMNTDWTSIFRQNHGVDEYILIGECDDGQCGDNWLTWGNPHHILEEEDDDAMKNDGSSDNAPTPPVQPTPSYILDGYVRYDLNELAPHQFSRFDCRTSKTGRTVSFRKQRDSNTTNTIG